ncbi:MAG: ArsR/SmtB family transcription factor [Ignavibacteriaceae bacterium]
MLSEAKLRKTGKIKEDFQSEVLSAICHPNRIKIVKALQKQALCNCEMMPLIGLEQSNLSRHLKSMEKSGILVSWKDGLRVNYKIADDRILDILDLAEKIAFKNIKQVKDLVES